MTRLLIVGLVLALCTVVSACGQKGNLYMPSSQLVQEQAL